MRADLPLVVGNVAQYARAVRARLFRRLPWAGGEAWAAAGGWDDATVPPRPIGYRAIIIAECARGSLRGRGAQLSAAAKSPAFNAADSGAMAVNPPGVVDKSGEGGTVWAYLAICSSLPCILRLP